MTPCFQCINEVCSSGGLETHVQMCDDVRHMLVTVCPPLELWYSTLWYGLVFIVCTDINFMTQ